jgi:sulfite reductase (NADPH) flavoprotein alpha-component
VELDEPFAQWRTALLANIEAIASGKKEAALPKPVAPVAASTAFATNTHSRETPLFAPLIEKVALTRGVSSKLTLHLGFSVADSGLHYEAGDACGVIARNDWRLVTRILELLKFSGEEQVELPWAGVVTLYQALLHSLQITRLNRKIVQAYATKGNCQRLLDLLVPEQQSHLDKYTNDRGLIDLLIEYPGVIASPADLAAIFPKLSPRLYSISSSPVAHVGQVHATVAVVRYRSHNIERGGVCSTLFADRAFLGDRLPIYIQPNKKFRLPQAADAPIIMIGPGTGIAPFRAFLHERRVLGSTGRNWLFFGERSATTDFLYCHELQSMVADRHLTRLDTAFSRDQERKIYVQDKMVEQGETFWQWLQDGASVYVCGDASRMAKDVDAALHSIVEKQGNLDQDAAREYVQQLKDEHRYHRDVY